MTQKKNISLKKKKGQSLLEFLFVSVFFIFLLALTYQSVIVFTMHQYISYVTFMAARAYQAAGPNPGDQRARAFQTLKAYLPAESLIQKNLDPSRLQELPDGPSSNLEFENFGRVGQLDAVYIPVPAADSDFGPGAVIDQSGSGQQDNWIGVKMRVPFVTLPLGTDLRSSFGYLTIAAYSYLGREVTTSECREYFNDRGAGASPLDMEDQGC
jgi:hypothetical protein